jgi:DNA polymerase sigma
MFHPSIKKENLIIIEDNSEDSKTGIKKQAETPSLHRTEKESENLRKRQEKGKQIAQYSRRPVTRETTKSTSISESVFKGTDVVYDDKDDLFAEPDQMQDLPETRDSDSTEDEDHSSGLSSKYMIKLRKPQAAIDLNLPAPVEEYPEFKVKVRKEKDRVKELQSMVKQLKKEKALVEQWNARQQEKIQDFKRKRKEQKGIA